MPPKVTFRTGPELEAAGATTAEVRAEHQAVWARMDYLMRANGGDLPADAAREYEALEKVLGSIASSQRMRQTADEDVAIAKAMAKQWAAINAANGVFLEERGGVYLEERGRREWVRDSDGVRAVVRPGERFAEHPVVAHAARQNAQRDEALIGVHGGVGEQIRAAISTSSGSAIVPTLWSGDIIDKARNYSAVFQAGAQLVPMDAKIVQIGRLTGDPTSAFRAESATITASDPTFDNVTLTATSMSCLVKGSMEWFQDAENANAVVVDAIAKSMALQLDLVALFGGLTTGNEGFSLTSPPNPRGILPALLALASTSVLGGVTNGTAQTTGSYWNEVLDTIFTVRDYNESPNALIWNSKLARQYAKAYDTTGQPLATPADVEALQRFVSNQIPSFTSGTMTSRATDLFVGDFTQLLVGQRLAVTVQPLVERYADSGEIGLIAHWRGDVQPARPRAFAVYRYLQGA